jgi:hypothetical protein
MLGKLFSSPEVDRFADWIVGEVKKALPVKPTPAQTNIAQRAERLFTQIEQQAKIFSQTTKLSVYKRARLAARVREGMIAHGYSDSFVKGFTFDLLRQIQAAAAKKPVKAET